MKAGNSPEHVMRWAPQDWLSSPLRVALISERDHVARLAYLEILFHLYSDGGRMLRADVPGAVGITEAQATRAVSRLLKSGRLIERDGFLENQRVNEDLQREREFRQGQAEFGRKRWKGKAEASHRVASPTLSPPSPAPAPAPTPETSVVGDGLSKRESPPPPTPPPNGGGGGRGREQLRLDDDSPEPIPKSKRRRRTGPREPTERETETVAGFLASLNALGRKCRPSPALLLAVQDALDLGYTPAQLRVQPLIAHAHFSDGRVLRLAPEVLLRPGGNGTFAWLSLLGKADSITLPPKLVKVARDLGVASTLESMHVTLNTKLL